MKKIVIKEDTVLPGTDLILEKGDVVIVKEGKLKEGKWSIKSVAEAIAKAYDRSTQELIWEGDGILAEMGVDSASELTGVFPLTDAKRGSLIAAIQVAMVKSIGKAVDALDQDYKDDIEDSEEDE